MMLKLILIAHQDVNIHDTATTQYGVQYFILNNYLHVSVMTTISFGKLRLGSFKLHQGRRFTIYFLSKNND